MMNSKIYKRKRIIINPSFQYRLIIFFFVVSIVMSVAILSFSWKTYSSFITKLSEKEAEMSLYTDLIDEFVEAGVQVFWVPAEFKKEVVTRLVIFTLLLSVIVVLIGVIISHRIAGPLHRLNNYLIKFSKGEPITNLRFRDKDEFQSLAYSFNRCVKYVTDRYGAVLTSEEKFLEDMEIYISKIKDEEIKKNLSDKISKFKTGKYVKNKE